MRKLVKLMILVLTVAPVWAEDRLPFPESPAPQTVAKTHWSRRLWQASLAAVAAGSVVDMTSSLGKHETNGLLANHQGVFSTQGIGLKLVMAGAAVGTQQFLLHHHSSPRAYKTGALVNFAAAGAMTAAAVHNYHVKPVQ